MAMYFGHETILHSHLRLFLRVDMADSTVPHHPRTLEPKIEQGTTLYNCPAHLLRKHPSRSTRDQNVKHSELPNCPKPKFTIRQVRYEAADLVTRQGRRVWEVS